MDLLQSVVLALLQGLTEFLPISSSAHLILPVQILGWPDQGLAFDVAVHVGTLVAVIHYFRHQLASLLNSWITTGFSSHPDESGRLAWLIIIATLPAGLFGFLFNDWIEQNFRTSLVIACATIGFGLLLWWADSNKQNQVSLMKMTLSMAIMIGLAQALALIPGTSRSGITITAALLLGLNRSDAATLSFLLSIPLIMAAGLFKGYELTNSPTIVDWSLIMVGTIVAGVSAWICIHFFLVFINRIGMLPFVIYRLALGTCLLVFFI